MRNLAHTKKGSFSVLILGDDSRSALGVVRSLGGAGIKVTVGVENNQSLLLYSRYADDIIYFPASSSHVSNWIAKVKEIISSRRFDLIIPVTDSSCVILSENRNLFASLNTLALADKESFDVAQSKKNTLELADKLNIPISRYLVASNIESLDALFGRSGFIYPLVVKPVYSKVIVGEYRLDISATVIKTQKDLINYAKPTLWYVPLVVQEYFHGVGIGQEFLCKDGEILAAFQHERINETEGSGGSSFRKSVPLDEELLGCSKKILLSLRWTGVIMIEYKKNKETEKFVLIELNGRFWGSLPLALVSGVDFPRLLFEFLVEKKKPSSVDYRFPVYCRNITNDLRWYYHTISDKSVLKKLFLLGKYTSTVFLNFLLRRESWDTFRWYDPLPGFTELFFIFRSSIHALQNSLINKTWWRSTSVLFNSKNVLGMLKRNPVILLVCFGNISRSPFAEAYLKKLMEGSITYDLRVRSAGLYPEAGRKASPWARAIAQECGIALEDHTSCILDEKLVNSAGIIFFMDRLEYCTIKKRFPHAIKKLFPVRMFAGRQDNLEIYDPWGRAQNDYRASFHAIQESLEGFMNFIKSEYKNK